VPDGYAVHELEKTLAAPTRLRAKPTFSEMASFARYVNRFKNEATTVFADRDRATVTAVIDFHESRELPSHCEHVATFVGKLSEAWKAWIGANRAKMNQVDFAEFIEANAADVIEPSGAALLEVASNLEVNRSVRFKSGIRLHDGRTNLVFEETTSGPGAKGEVAIPAKIVLAIAPFQGGDPYKVEARLRYRITDDGKVVFWYDLVRPDVVLRAAFDALVKTFAEAASLDVHHGRFE
ncbi:MAG TPA: DUF2303 family protein, partial [Anaeromyxobacteraceae bacterium]|nr:DUF2303 family protein [Anaeromyxobacteraceae bacterium]